MDPRKALEQMIARSGKSRRLISLEIGRHPTYVTSLLHSGSCPQVDTFAAIAESCGCQIVLRFPDEDVQLDGWDVNISTEAYLRPGRKNASRS